MKYVIDSNVAIKWVKNEVDSPIAIRLRDEYRTGAHSLISPDFLIAEAGYALFKMQSQGKLKNAPFLLNTLLIDCPVLVKSAGLVALAVNIVTHLRISFYDAMFVALAQKEQCELVTADTRLLNACQQHYPFVIPLSTLS